MSIILKAENISKQYRLGTVGTGTLGHDLNRWWAKIRGNEDPYLKVGAVNDRSSKANEDYVWALQDINFEVKQGQVLGIIGKNGAGKSTLLKILSKVTSPTTGRIKTRGRIASLLEVGTGFHGELTGRENIFMNGAVLGMNKAEINRKLDEIIDFSGCEMFIDTPVKRYSSGMTVRLGFAVAAHLEPEILVVDEVLAVGDAEFQKKAIGKMQDLSIGEGRTVLFVSHNMASVKSLCHRGLVLENGCSVFDGEIAAAVSYYLSGDSESQNLKTFTSQFDMEDFCLHKIQLNAVEKSPDDYLNEFDEIELTTSISLKQNNKNLHFTYVLKNENGEALFTISHNEILISLKEGLNNLTCKFPKGFLNIGTYYLSFYLIQDSKTTLFKENDILSFHIQEGVRPLGSWYGKEPGFIKPKFYWEIS